MTTPATWTAHPKQALFGDAVFSGRYRYLLFGGAIRGGKTAITAMILAALCRIFARSRWAIVRRDLPTLKRNTIPDLDNLLPRPFFQPLNHSDWTYRATNGSELILFPESLETDREYNRWRGLGVNGFLLEEANELIGGRKTFTKAQERAGSWIVPDAKHQPPPLILLTCNPSPGWLKDDFYDPWEAGTLQPPYFFLPSLPHDNPSNPAAYLEGLEDMAKSAPEDYARFVKGQWRGLESGLLFRELGEQHRANLGGTPRPGTTRMIAADWGWDHPAPALWVETLGGLDGPAVHRVYREWCPRETTPAAWAAEVIKQSTVGVDADGQPIYECDVVVMDSAADAQGQDGTPSVMEQMRPTFRQAGWRLVPAQKGPGSLKASTMLLHAYFAGPTPSLVIDDACPLLWYQLTTIRRGDPTRYIAQDRDVEAPHQENDLTAALRYWASSRPNPPKPTNAELAARDALWQKLQHDPESYAEARVAQQRATWAPVRDDFRKVVKVKRYPWER